MNIKLKTCENPFCGCGICKDIENPERDCAFVICACGMCEEI